MNKITGKEVVIGAKFWVEGYRAASGLEAVQVLVTEVYYGAPHLVGGIVVQGGHGQLCQLFLGDLGVEPYAYDKRCTQLFHTKEELLEAKKDWHTGNANDYDQEGRNLYSKHGAL